MRGGSGCARGAAKSDQRGRPHHHHLAGSLLPSPAGSATVWGEGFRDGEGRVSLITAPPSPLGKVKW